MADGHTPSAFFIGQRTVPADSREIAFSISCSQAERASIFLGIAQLYSTMTNFLAEPLGTPLHGCVMLLSGSLAPNKRAAAQRAARRAHAACGGAKSGSTGRCTLAGGRRTARRLAAGLRPIAVQVRRQQLFFGFPNFSPSLCTRRMKPKKSTDVPYRRKHIPVESL